MTTASPAQLFTAAIGGTWDPGSVPTITSDNYPAAQQAPADAVAAVAGITDDTLDFHVVGTDYPGDTAKRTRWHVESHVYGPSLQLGATEPHESQVTLVMLLYPLGERLQALIDDDAADMRFRGVFSTIFGALLLRHAWGPSPRTITLNGQGTGTFTPSTLRYNDPAYSTEIEVPYDAPDKSFAAFPFVLGDNGRPPALWLVTGDQSAAWEVSYCVGQAGQAADDRWDVDPQAVPEFTPLTWPVMPPEAQSA